ncbi:MAG: hypothetical protein CM1200mP34_0850 [Verrucomicrobiales bacterium]|nr:MAG: hypothetical protein CM1200mP34_0850 [Verrucomicrobiales bacterium]
MSGFGLQDDITPLAAVAAARPPLGLNGSCENAMHPLPPLPALA